MIATRCFFHAREVLDQFSRIDGVLDGYPATDATGLARQGETLRTASATAWSIVRHAGSRCFVDERRTAFEALADYLATARTAPIDVERARNLMHATGIDICVLDDDCPSPTPAGS